MISAERYSEIESRFSELNFLVIGDLMIDNYFWGDTERISPEAPVPVVNIRSSSSTPGGDGNVVVNLRSFILGKYRSSLIQSELSFQEYSFESRNQTNNS